MIRKRRELRDVKRRLEKIEEKQVADDMYAKTRAYLDKCGDFKKAVDKILTKDVLKKLKKVSGVGNALVIGTSSIVYGYCGDQYPIGPHEFKNSKLCKCCVYNNLAPKPKDKE